MSSDKKSKKGKKGRPDISAPMSFEHIIHTGYDPVQGGFTGLPTQWTGIVDPHANRPKPIIDPSSITSFDLERQKVSAFCVSRLKWLLMLIVSNFKLHFIFYF